MTTYIISFLFNMILGGLMFSNTRYLNQERIDKRKKWYLLITTLQLGLLCGFRASSVGYDTDNYIMMFDLVPGTWSRILENPYYFETGYSVYCAIIKILGGTAQTVLVLSSLFIVGSCCVFIYRHSERVVLSVFIIVSFPFFYSSFDIIRHFMATAFFLLGYKYIEEKRFWKYLLFIATGSVFHSFAWIFLLYYFIGKIKWNWVSFAAAIIGTLIAYVYIEDIAVMLGGWLGKGDGIKSGWIGDYGGGLKTAFMYFALLIVAIFAYSNLRGKTKADMMAMNHVLLMFIFSLLFINARMMTRMIMTQTAMLAIACPRLLDGKRFVHKGTYNILFLAFIAVGIGYHYFMLTSNWQNVVPYIPYWAD